MACLLKSGILKECGFQVGGIGNIIIGNKSEIESITYDTGGTITGITMTSGATAFTFEFERNTGQFLEEIQRGTVSKFILQSANFSISNLTQEKMVTLEELALSDVFAIVSTKANVDWFLGDKGSGLEAITNNRDTGTADADDSLFTVSLQGGNGGYAPTVAAGIAIGLL